MFTDVSKIPEPLRSRAPERTALLTIDKVRHFLHGYVSDGETTDEIRDHIRQTARRNAFFLRQYLAAIEEILNDPQPPGTLMHLVEGDGNRCIDHDQTDHGAEAVLQEFADLLQSAIEEVE